MTADFVFPWSRTLYDVKTRDTSSEICCLLDYVVGNFACACYQKIHEQPLELLAMLRGRLAHVQSLVVKLIQLVDSYE